MYEFLKQENWRSLEQQGAGLGMGISASTVGTVSCGPTATPSIHPLSPLREADPAQCITQAPWLLVSHWSWPGDDRWKTEYHARPCFCLLISSLNPAHNFLRGPLLRFLHLNHLEWILCSARPLTDTNSNQRQQTGNGLEQWGWIPNLWDHTPHVWFFLRLPGESEAGKAGTSRPRPRGLLLCLMRVRPGHFKGPATASESSIQLYPQRI